MIIYFAGKIIPAVCVLLLMYLGINILGKAEFGKYSLIYNTIGIVSTLCIGWIQQSMLRYNNHTEIDREKYFNQFSVYTILFSVTAGGIIFFLALFYFKISFAESLFSSSFCMLLSGLSVFLTSRQINFQSHRYAIIESVFYLITISIIVLISFLSIHKTFIHFYYAWIISAGIIYIFLLLTNYTWLPKLFKTKTDVQFFEKMFRFGFIISIWLFISSLFNVADRFIIQKYFGYATVGIYSTAYDFIYRLSSFLAMPALLTIHPAVTKYWNENKKNDTLKILRKGIMIVFLLFLAELILFGLLGNYIFQKYFHLPQMNLILFIFPLVLSSCLWQLALLLHKPLELFLMPKRMIEGIVLSIIANIMLNLFLIPNYGYQIAAITTLISTLIYIIYVVIRTPKNFWRNEL